MKILQDILYTCGAVKTTGRLDIPVTGLAFDSRAVAPGFVFIAVKGTQTDGHAYISQAIEKGATAIVCNEIPITTSKNITYVQVKDSAHALGVLAANFYDNPSGKLKLVGITGTNGKTTTATLLYRLFRGLGYPCGLISTIAVIIEDTELPASHTTPDAIKINELLNDMVQAGCSHVFMEVSSHAIDQERIAGLQFSGGVFTNLTHDHLDYHLTFKAYLEAKKKFFDHLPASSFALTNADDRNGSIMLQNTRAVKHNYGLKNMAEFKGRVMENQLIGMQIKIDDTEVYSPLSGQFNAYNLMAIYSTAMLLGEPKEDILKEISSLKGAEGRFDVIKSATNVTAIIDYAHTPDALENVLNTLNALRTHNEQLITITGAGGNRDKAKRPLMAAIASRLSNRIILTSDNPRTEDPHVILDEMEKGIEITKRSKTLVIENRKEAIKTAWNLAQPGDLILIAGKGHEKYQEIKGVRYPFDDKEIILNLMNEI